MIPKTVKVVIPTTYVNKVAAIKAIREISSLGLKDAKDFSEQTGTQVIEVRLCPRVDLNGNAIPAEEVYHMALRSLRTAGIEVKGPADARAELLEQVRQLAATAVLRDDYELAQELIAVLRSLG